MNNVFEFIKQIIRITNEHTYLSSPTIEPYKKWVPVILSLLIITLPRYIHLMVFIYLFLHSTNTNTNTNKYVENILFFVYMGCLFLALASSYPSFFTNWFIIIGSICLLKIQHLIYAKTPTCYKTLCVSLFDVHFILGMFLWSISHTQHIGTQTYIFTSIQSVLCMYKFYHTVKSFEK